MSIFLVQTETSAKMCSCKASSNPRLSMVVKYCNFVTSTLMVSFSSDDARIMILFCILMLNLLFGNFEVAVSSGKHVYKIHTPLHPSYIDVVKFGFTGVCIIFLFLL